MKWIRQKKIAKQCKKLQRETNTFTKQTAEWLNLIDTFNKSFKVRKDIKTICINTFFFPSIN